MATTDDDMEPNAQEKYDAELALELAKLQAYRKATEEEFAGLEANDPKTAAAARKQMLELVPDAAEQLAFLVKHADSESVRANVAKYIMSEALKTAEAGKAASAWEELFNQLKPDAETAK